MLRPREGRGLASALAAMASLGPLHAGPDGAASSSSSSSSMRRRGLAGAFAQALEAQDKERFTAEQWKARLDATDISRSQLDEIVMNFLVIEGYQDVARKFQAESGAEPEIPLETISDRVSIRRAVLSGDALAAIEQVNELNPEILENNTGLYFHLQQQRLIELLRAGQQEQALDLAHNELAPLAAAHPEFLDEVELTMTLLLFPLPGDDASSSSASAGSESNPLMELYSEHHRNELAAELNDAILKSQMQSKEPRLPVLLKRLTKAQHDLSDQIGGRRGSGFPACRDFATGQIDGVYNVADARAARPNGNDEVPETEDDEPANGDEDEDGDEPMDEAAPSPARRRS